MVIDTDYNPLLFNVQHKSNAPSNKPKEMEIEDTADSVGGGPIQNNIGEHQQSTPDQCQRPRRNTTNSIPTNATIIAHIFRRKPSTDHVILSVVRRGRSM